VGIDWFEMRRRINSKLNPNVIFSYGPYGALIPLLNYESAGFFHCLDNTPHPSASPSSSSLPTMTSSPTASPTETCSFVYISILHDFFSPERISWDIANEEGVVISSTPGKQNTLQSQRVCLAEGTYNYTIYDSLGWGMFSPGYYNITTFDGALIVEGGGGVGGSSFVYERTVFSIPFDTATVATVIKQTPYPTPYPTNEPSVAAVSSMLPSSSTSSKTSRARQHNDPQ
jgi:hypothetical protein